MDGSQVILRRVGIKGPIIELLGPILMIAYLLYTGMQAVAYWIPVLIWLGVILVQMWFALQARLIVTADELIYRPLPWFRRDRWGWQLPLSQLQVEVQIDNGNLARFRPWLVSGLFRGRHQSHLVLRLLDWCRINVPTDLMNRSRLAEQLRDADEDVLEAVRQYPVLRVLHERDVPVYLYDEAPEMSKTNPENDARGKSVEMTTEKTRSVFRWRRAPTARENDLLAHRSAVVLLVLLAMMALGSVYFSVVHLEEGIANLEALAWLLLPGLLVPMIFWRPVFDSGLNNSGGWQLLAIAWLISAACSYPLLVEMARATGEEPELVAYEMAENRRLVPVEEGWPVVVRFRTPAEYWDSIPQGAQYPLEMRRAPLGIYLVNVDRVVLSQQAWQQFR